jgi:MFS family permease
MPEPELSSSSPVRRLTPVQWTVCVVAVIGFAFDIYELLMLPLIVRPALQELAGQGVVPGTPEFASHVGRLFYIPAVAGGLFGLLGGWLIDRFGRRRVLVWSILIYSVSPLGAAFSTSVNQLLFFRCTTFIGVSVEFVAAVAWLAELFPEPKQREKVLGFTQAFSSIGGIMVAFANGLAIAYADKLPALGSVFGPIDNPHAPWRYTLVSGLIPAIPIMLLLPFLPESPMWLKKRAEGTLKRPSLRAIFSPELRRTTLITTLMFAMSYGAAFGALQAIPRIIPGLPEVKQEITAKLQTAHEAGNVAARFALAERLQKGIGAEKDLDAGVKLYEEASAKGYAPAQNQLAKLYLEGQGVPKDADKAVELFRKSAEQEFAPAQFELGLLFWEGEGVAKDVQQAVNLFRKAAEKGFAPAQFALGMAYLKGEGIEKDLENAYHWLYLASKQKHSLEKQSRNNLKQSLQNLKKQLLPEQLAKSQKKAQDFKPKKTPPSAEEKKVKSIIGRTIQSNAANVTKVQEFGGLAGRVLLAFLVVAIVSRRAVIRMFQVPGLVVMPLVFVYAATTNINYLYVGCFFAGLLTVGQFSFWGNYLPRVYPLHLRGTGQSFAANIGGRMFGTFFAWITATVAVQDFVPGESPAVKLAYTAAAVAFTVYLVGFIASFWLPEPKTEELPE